MEYELTVVGPSGRETPVVVDAGEAATVADLRTALAETGPAFLDGNALDDSRLLTDTPMVSGSRLSFGAPGARPEPSLGRELAVVSGPNAGRAVPLPDRQRIVVGRSTACDLVIDDPEVSRRHATIEGPAGDDQSATIVDCGSRNGTGHRGYQLTGPTRLAFGEQAQLGESVVSVRPTPAADAQLEFDPTCRVVRFNRPPRIVVPRRPPEVLIPAAPDAPRGFRFPLATVFIPLVLAAILYFVLPAGSFIYLIFLALSPVMAIGHVVSERRSGRKDHKDKVDAYHRELAAARVQLAAHVVAEERVTRELHPDPAAIVRIATGPTSRLFERRVGDEDFGRVRVGQTDRAVDVVLTGQDAGAESLPTVYGVPSTIDLTAVGVVGVAGRRPAALPIVRSLLVQLATLHAPHDLGVVVVTGSDETDDWTWATWLPHTTPHRADIACRRMVACDREQAEARVGELLRVIDERTTERQSALRNQAPAGRRLLVVLDGARRLRNIPGLARVLAEGPDVGVYAVCLDASEQELPEDCNATVVVTSTSGSRVRVSRPGQAAEEGVLADGLPTELATKVAQALAPRRVLGARFGDDGDLPDRVRYLDLAGLGPDPEPDDIVARWALQPGGRSTTVLLGVGPTGPVTVDLRRDGPHALIAGTSGAGKSELLQTLVASLALGNSPDALNLVLVDYKGGSAFAECAQLPHCVGMITDLDGHLANRALASLSAELRRRESILAAAGVKDIEDYWAATGGVLPRLVIVVDEFATLVEEVPDFVNGVVGIGMRGRSLGVHVVLATQRPGGVVNAEMRANLNLRLCLRVTGTEESNDVIDAPDAGRISRLHPGRGYVRTGHTDLSIVQCARIGWPRVSDEGLTVDAAATAVSTLSRTLRELARPRLEVTSHAADGHDGDTDLTVLVRAVVAAAGRADVGAPPSPWLPPLPEVVTVAQLDAPTATSPVAATIGLADQPAAQVQVPFTLDLDHTGPVVVAGMARSGRSSVLRVLAAELAANSSPADVHLYALDYGSRALAPLVGLPHCGAYIDADDPDRVTRLLDLLTSEVSSRTRLLAARGCGSITEQRAGAAPESRLPYIVLLLDRYEAFLARHSETDGGRLVEVLDALLRQGSALGILPVLTTDRSGFTHRLGGMAATRLVLRQADPDDVGVYGLNPREVPRRMPAGRLIATPGEVEIQVALLAPDPEGAAQAAAVDALSASLGRRWDGIEPALLPHRIDPLPEAITPDEVDVLRVDPQPASPTVCTVGVGGDHLAPVDVDLAEAGSAFVVAGPPRSGRSTALAAIVSSLTGRSSGELPVVVCCPRPSPLTDLADLPGVVAVLRGPDLGGNLEDTLVDLDGRPYVVVVDDAELLAEGLAADVLDRVVRTARDEGNVVIAGGTTEDLAVQRYRGWLAALRRGRCGLLLNPTSYVDGEVLDIRLPRSTCGGWPAGRALLADRGSTTSVQVPLTEPAALIAAQSTFPRQ